MKARPHNRDERSNSITWLPLFVFQPSWIFSEGGWGCKRSGNKKARPHESEERCNTIARPLLIVF